MWSPKSKMFTEKACWPCTIQRTYQDTIKAYFSKRNKEKDTAFKNQSKPTILFPPVLFTPPNPKPLYKKTVNVIISKHTSAADQNFSHKYDHRVIYSEKVP